MRLVSRQLPVFFAVERCTRHYRALVGARRSALNASLVDVSVRHVRIVSPVTGGCVMGIGNEPVGRSDGAQGTVRNLAGLAVDDFGESDARSPLVLLHGLTFDRTMWQPALSALRNVDPGRRALAFDLPGHGESGGWDTYDVDRVAHGVHRAVVEAGLDEPVIVGHSLAAIVAGVYAGQFPTRGVVNVDQPLQTAQFAGFLESIAYQLRGPGFPAMWEQFAASMHTELL